MGGVFVKKWTFPQRRVHYVQHQYFLFYILLIWAVRTHTTHPPAYGSGLGCDYKGKWSGRERDHKAKVLYEESGAFMRRLRPAGSGGGQIICREKILAFRSAK